MLVLSGIVVMILGLAFRFNALLVILVAGIITGLAGGIGVRDTIAAIAGSIAEAHYVIPEDIKRECIHRLSAELLDVITEFEIKLKKRYVDMTLTNDE